MAAPPIRPQNPYFIFAAFSTFIPKTSRLLLKVVSVTLTVYWTFAQ
jgi:hypothetical protein